jgi:hypothetical protein
MAKEIATTKWCPCCNHSQQIKGFRSYRCKDCWIAAGKPKVEVYFKAMDKSEAIVKSKSVAKIAKKAVDKVITLIEDRKDHKSKKKPTTKKVVKTKK